MYAAYVGLNIKIRKCVKLVNWRSLNLNYGGINMRILSQDGKHDFPYEKVCLGITNTGQIFAQGDIWGMRAEDNFIEVARYSTEAKARNVMEMLRNEYCGYKLEEVYHDGTNFYCPVFQFPQDKEVMVLK